MNMYEAAMLKCANPTDELTDRRRDTLSGLLSMAAFGGTAGLLHGLLGNEARKPQTVLDDPYSRRTSPDQDESERSQQYRRRFGLRLPRQMQMPTTPSPLFSNAQAMDREETALLANQPSKVAEDKSVIRQFVDTAIPKGIVDLVPASGGSPTQPTMMQRMWNSVGGGAAPAAKGLISMPTRDMSRLMSSWWGIPAGLGTMAAGYYGAKGTVDSLYAAGDESEKDQQVEEAKKRFERALRSQYRSALGSSAKVAAAEDPRLAELRKELDLLCDSCEKAAGNAGDAGDEDLTSWLPAVGGPGTTLNMGANVGLGTLLTLMAGGGLLAGHTAYNYTRKNSPQVQLAAAQRLRARRRPAPALLEIGR